MIPRKGSSAAIPGENGLTDDGKKLPGGEETAVEPVESSESLDADKPTEENTIADTERKEA